MNDLARHILAYQFHHATQALAAAREMGDTTRIRRWQNRINDLLDRAVVTQ